MEVLEASRRDAGPLHEGDDVVLLQADDASEFVRRKVALVDESIERAQVDAEVVRRPFRAHPSDGNGHEQSVAAGCFLVALRTSGRH